MAIELEETLIQKLRGLPREQQKKVLEYIDTMEQTSAKKGKSLAGLWADLGIELNDADLKEMRREMWANFPRDL